MGSPDLSDSCKRRERYDAIAGNCYADRFRHIEELETIELDLIQRMAAFSMQTNELMTVLDIGTGTGRIARLFQEKGKVIGLDLSENMIRHCLANMPSPLGGESVDFLVADMDRLPFKESCFDVILMIGTLESEENPIEKIKLLQGYCRPGGKIIFNLWNSRNLVARMVNYLKRTEYRRTHFSHRYLLNNLRGRNMTYVMHSYWVTPTAVARKILARTGRFRTLVLRLMRWVENMNARLGLNLGSNWCIGVCRKGD